MGMQGSGCAQSASFSARASSLPRSFPSSNLQATSNLLLPIAKEPTIIMAARQSELLFICHWIPRHYLYLTSHSSDLPDPPRPLLPPGPSVRRASVYCSRSESRCAMLRALRAYLSRISSSLCFWSLIPRVFLLRPTQICCFFIDRLVLVRVFS